jgi:hypothetical protein
MGDLDGREDILRHRKKKNVSGQGLDEAGNWPDYDQ